jgi:hypothetical protein
MKSEGKKIFTIYLYDGDVIRLEPDNACSAKHVITICSALIDDFINRVPESKQNSIETEIYDAIIRKKDTRHELHML